MSKDRLTRSATADNVTVLRRNLRSITTHERLRWCALKKCKPEMGVWVSGDGDGRKATPTGIMTCNNVHCCPSCARRIRARRMRQLTAALRAGLEKHQRLAWQMISVTVRHCLTMPLATLRRGLMLAWRRCRQSGTVARIMKKRVAATARALEVTRGGNGWHPHLHVALLTSEWTEDERDAFARRWAECVEWVFTMLRSKKDSRVSDVATCRAAGYAVRPSLSRGIHWSEKTLRRGDDSQKLEAYLTDIGLELTLGQTKTTHVEASRTPWDIAQSAVRGDDADLELWHEYEAAMKGARCIELDDRAAELARTASDIAGPCDDVGEVSGELDFTNAPTVGEAAVYVSLHPEMMATVRAYERIDARATRVWLEAAEAPGPLTVEAVTAKIDDCVRRMVKLVHEHCRRRRGPEQVGPPDHFLGGRGSATYGGEQAESPMG